MQAIQEWDDGACLAQAVERLDFERREVRELGCLRRCVTASTGLTLIMLAALATIAMVPTLQPLTAAAMIGVLRGAIVEGIDQEIAQHVRQAAERQRELQVHLRDTEWLLGA